MSDQNFNPQSQYIDPQQTFAQPQYAQPGYAMPPQYAQPGYAMPPQYAQPGYAMPPQYAQPGYGQPQYYAAPQPVYEAPAPSVEPEVILQESPFADFGFGEEDSVGSGHNFGGFMEDDNKIQEEPDDFNAFNAQTPNFDPAAVEAASKVTSEDKAMFTSTTTIFDPNKVEADSKSKSNEDIDIFSNFKAVGEMEQTASETPTFDAAAATLQPQPQTFTISIDGESSTPVVKAPAETFASISTEAPAAAPSVAPATMPVAAPSVVPATTPVVAPETAAPAAAPAAPSAFMSSMAAMMSSLGNSSAAASAPANPVPDAPASIFSQPDVVTSAPASQTIQDISSTSSPEKKGDAYWNNIDRMLNNFDDGQHHQDISNPIHAAQPASIPVYEEAENSLPFQKSAEVANSAPAAQPVVKTQPIETKPVVNVAPSAPSHIPETFATLQQSQVQPQAQMPIAPKPEPVVVEQPKPVIEPVVVEQPKPAPQPIVVEQPKPVPQPIVVEQPKVESKPEPKSQAFEDVFSYSQPTPSYAAPSEDAEPIPEEEPVLDKKAQREAARAARNARVAEARAQRDAEREAKAAAKANKKNKKNEEIEPEVEDDVLPQGSLKSARRAKVEEEEEEFEKPNGFKGILYRIFPNKHDKLLEIIRKMVALISVVALIVCGVYFLVTYLNSKSQEKKNAELASIMSTSAASTQDWVSIYNKYPNVQFPTGMQIKFADLYALNKDLVGWIKIDGLGIDYPVVQTTDDSYYLKHDFYQKSSDYGTIFMSANNSLGIDLDLNTVIYGHAMRRDKQMFSRLHDYKDKQSFIDNPIIEYNTLYGNYKFKVYCTFITNGSSDDDNGYILNYTFTNLSSQDSFAGFVAEINQRRLYETGVDILPTDKIICLSTCSYEFDNARFVVVGRLLRDGESEEIDTSKVVDNESPRYPQAWYDAKGETNPYASYTHWQPS